MNINNFTAILFHRIHRIHTMATEEEFVFETVQFDPRFPNQNQTRHCYQSYVDFHRCQKLRGESYEPCQYFKKVFTTMCPNAWIAKWNDQLEDGTFPTKI